MNKRFKSANRGISHEVHPYEKATAGQTVRRVGRRLLLFFFLFLSLPPIAAFIPTDQGHWSKAMSWPPCHDFQGAPVFGNHVT